MMDPGSGTLLMFKFTLPNDESVPPGMANNAIPPGRAYNPVADGGGILSAKYRLPPPAPVSWVVQTPRLEFTAVPNSKQLLGVAKVKRSCVIVALLVPSVIVNGVKAGDWPLVTNEGTTNENSKASTDQMSA